MNNIYKLPHLDYGYSSLEPYISKKVMKLHYDKHHATYVMNANKILHQLQELRKKGLIQNENLLIKELSFNIGGHKNHCFFWKNISPKGGNYSLGKEIIQEINSFFGSIDHFKKIFISSAISIQGSGWAYLGVDQKNKNLIIGQIYNQQDNLPLSIKPILMLDMWEHAFYIDYLNVKIDYVNAFWNIINWAYVNKQFLKIIQ